MKISGLALTFCALWLAYTRQFTPGLTFVLGLIISTLPGLSEVLRVLLNRNVFHKAFETYPAIDHLVLNTRVDTSWCNLGDWERTTEYAAACEALALRLAKASHLEKGLRVLDVGCGTGQSLQLWHDRFRPAKLVGITLSEAHVRFATSHLPAEIGVHAADAVRWMADEISKRQHFDRILALDSAYHFKTRQLFLQCAFDLLAPGGRLAIADIVLSPSITRRDRLSLRALLPRLGVPWQNVVTEIQLLNQFEAIGFRHVTGDDDITSHVFSGAAAFLAGRSQDPAIRAVTKPSLWLGYRAFSKVLTWLAGGNVLRFVIVSAQKPS